MRFFEPDNVDVACVPSATDQFSCLSSFHLPIRSSVSGIYVKHPDSKGHVFDVGVNNQIFGNYEYQQNRTVRIRTIQLFTDLIRKIDANLKSCNNHRKIVG